MAGRSNRDFADCANERKAFFFWCLGTTQNEFQEAVYQQILVLGGQTELVYFELECGEVCCQCKQLGDDKNNSS
jgi:hypothetical protein